MKRHKSIKNMSFHQLCEAIENGEESSIVDLDNFADETPADTDEDLDMDTEGEGMEDDDTMTETEGTVSVEIDPTAPLADILRTIADAIEGADMGDADIDDEDEDESEGEDDDDDVVVVDDTEDEDEDDDEEALEEQEESIAETKSSAYAAEVNSNVTRRRHDNKFTNKGTVDTDLNVESGEAEYVTLESKVTRRRATASDEASREPIAKSRLSKANKGKRLVDAK